MRRGEWRTMMSAEDVLAVLDLLDRAGIRVWLDGGWGVDALLGEQTRPHNDLDIVVRTDDLDRYDRALRAHGFRLMRDDGPYNYVLVDDAGREVDVHSFDPATTLTDADGVLVHGPNGLAYPVDALTGSGTVLGRRVACCTPEYQVRSHTGYEIDADDVHDVLALHRRFGVPLPPPYA
ncbi:nucleotidyltransferase family protein [Streptomyces sp. NPDC051662]|uniref:nucleotidyltransferase domain-containing protein n=1 Tax=Streptomyces sp. NPDC051662 TaxID=3154750 RepID=UPI003425278A